MGSLKNFMLYSIINGHGGGIDHLIIVLTGSMHPGRTLLAGPSQQTGPKLMRAYMIIMAWLFLTMLVRRAILS